MPDTVRGNDVHVKITNFRSLYGEHSVRLPRITILVGENSSGKTALLAAIAAAVPRIVATPARLEDEPFLLPTFQSQLSNGESEFELGCVRNILGEDVVCVATFSKRLGSAMPSRVVLSYADKFRVRALAKSPRGRYDFFPEEKEGRNRSSGSVPQKSRTISSTSVART